jgi:peroxiredoxin
MRPLKGVNHAMFQRSINIPLLIFSVTVVLLLATACSGNQASPTPEDVVVAEAAEMVIEPENVDSGSPKGDNPSLEVVVSEGFPDSQNEEPTEPEAPPVEPLPSPTPISFEQTPPESNEDDPGIPEPTSEASQPTNVEAPANVAVDPSVGSMAPDFTLTTLDGEIISLSELRGKNVLINYWATWCPPCLNELNALENVQKQYEGQDFVVITINGIEQDNLGDVQATVEEYGITYPVLLDEDEIFWNDYRILFLPTSVYINEQGIIRFIKLGEQSEAEFSSMVDQLLSDQL